MLFSDNQNSVKSSPKSRNSETQNLKISSGLWPSLSAPQSKRALLTNPTLNPILLTDFTCQRGSSARHACPDCARQLLSNLRATFAARATSSNFFLFEQLFTTLLVAKNRMTPSFSLFGALQLNGLTKKSDNVSS
jgi:hypothetical protein